MGGFGEAQNVIGSGFVGKPCWPFALVLVGIWEALQGTFHPGFTDSALTLPWLTLEGEQK